MTFRLDFLRRVMKRINVHGQQRRKKIKNSGRKVFLEQLEDRRMLNGIPIAKEDLSYITAVNTALSITSGNSLKLNDWDAEGVVRHENIAV